MTEHVEAVVLGAGVVGLAIARALALQGREVLILERHDAIGTETSSRNSEVIHAGIYYPQGSLKARACVEGRRQLYAYLESHGVDHAKCGKLIVATSQDQIPALEEIYQKGLANDVEGLRLIDKAEAKALEPALRVEAAILSPETGIIDSHGLMLALQGDAEERGAIVAFLSPAEQGRVKDNGRFELSVGGEAAMTLGCDILINAGGLGAQAFATRLEGLDSAHVPPLYFAKGHYFTLGARAPFSRLIYPVPEKAGLGVHLTLDLGGQARFGPDVKWVDEVDYTMDPSRGESFYQAIRTYWPNLADGALQPGYTGIRPKLQAPGEAARDFLIQGPGTHGLKGLVNLFGIESPGLTSALALADQTLNALEESPA
ncbi:MAG: NAD(P)/FAD-dependent oxidoreductase [Magnetovibrionaceae bacterium]